MSRSGIITGLEELTTPLHWVLDIVFREDESRVQKGHGAQNLARLHRLAGTLLKFEKRSNGTSTPSTQIPPAEMFARLKTCKAYNPKCTGSR
jgi:hypothetical protein